MKNVAHAIASDSQVTITIAVYESVAIIIHNWYDFRNPPVIW